eukprot:2401965-Pyramimonas_sp.AAC.1
MAKSTTVDTVMLVAMPVTMLTATTARPVTARVLITPTTMTASSRRCGSLWQEFDMRAADAREWPARYYLTRIVPPSTRARACE